MKISSKNLCNTKKLLSQFRQGTGPMAMNAIDFYEEEDGSFLKHEWAMGGESFHAVLEIPDRIEGYNKIIA